MQGIRGHHQTVQVTHAVQDRGQGGDLIASHDGHLAAYHRVLLVVGGHQLHLPVGGAGTAQHLPVHRHHLGHRR